MKCSRFLLALFGSLLLTACSQNFGIYYPDGQETKFLDIFEMQKEVPRFDQGSIVIQNLGKTEHLSAHLVWIQDREKPHLHAGHDATVQLLKGKGTLTLRGQKLALKPGMLVTIPRGAPHFFVNESKHPAAAFVVFTPPFDGKDVVPVTP
jgi:quercetin dioxygenase-like cupin family protein